MAHSATSRPASSAGSRSRAQSQSRSRSQSRSGYRDEDAGNTTINGTAGAGASTMDADEETFCNSFWGSKDEPAQDRGYDALMGRVKGASKMLDDFRAFFKERAAIEDDYARRLAKLARMPLGKDEKGELANVLKRVQYELDQSGRCHNELATVIRQTMETRVREYETTRDVRRKNAQGSVERSWKNKQNQEALVNKAMEKYKSDCILINSFSARLALTQGKDLDKVTNKLDKAQQTVQVNEAEYRQYCRALKDSHTQWVGEWKAWCDLVQDLEEERTDFVRNALWSYVNAVSLICVKDDESCENVRQAVESCDVRREMAGFIYKEGGGNLIQDPPHFIDFSDGDKGVAPPAMHPAKFARSSAKVDQAPFDGLEKLQAAVYPQQRGGRSGTATPAAARSGAPSPAAPSANASASNGLAPSPSLQHPPAQQQSQRRDSSTRSRPNSGTDFTTSGQPSQSAMQHARAPSPVKQDLRESASIPPSASTPQAGASSVLPPGRSRPPSRAENPVDKEDASAGTTAQRLQHMASQKRLSAAAFKGAVPPSNPASPHPNPLYPYASASPRQAEPYRPPADGSEPAKVSQSASAAILPPPPAGPAAKKEDDPLLAALAKLRNPSSAVDVLPPTSPAAQSTFGRSGSQQQPRSHSPYMQPPTSAGFDGRNSPSQPAPRKQYTGPGSAVAASTGNRTYAAPEAQQGMPTSARPVTTANMYMQRSRSRPASPQPPNQPRAPSPAAAMMRPPSRSADAPPAQAQYGQAFPGERRQSIAPPPSAMTGPHSRPTSPALGGLASPTPGAPGYAGVGVQGRVSPAPHQQTSDYGMRSPSPGPGHGGMPPQQQHPGYGAPSAQAGYTATGRPLSAYGAPQNQAQGRHRSTSSFGGHASAPPPASGAAPVQAGRPTTPLGISLDANGQVTQDQLAEQYAAAQRQAYQPRPTSAAPQQHYPSHQYPASPAHPQHQPPFSGGQPAGQQSAAYRRGASIQRQAQTAQQNRLSQGPGPASPAPGIVTSPSAPVYMGNPTQSPAPHQQQHQAGYASSQYQQPGYGSMPAGQSMQRPVSQNFNRSQSMATNMNGPASPAYNRGPPQQQQPQHYQQHAQQPSGSYRGQPQQYQQPYQQQQQQQQQQSVSGAPSYPGPQQTPGGPYHQQQPPSHPSQTPLQPPAQTSAPTNQYTENGQPIQFFVKAIYKYDAQTPEEFSFQKDDVIAVTETEEDGWWHGFVVGTEGSGRAGGTIFPSNFVTLVE